MKSLIYLIILFSQNTFGIHFSNMDISNFIPMSLVPFQTHAALYTKNLSANIFSRNVNVKPVSVGESLIKIISASSEESEG